MLQAPSVRYAGDVGIYEQEDEGDQSKLVKVLECIVYVPIGLVALIVISVAKLAKRKE